MRDKILILMRHGETTKYKDDPNRGLTDSGEKAVIGNSSNIQRYIKGNVVILHSDTERAKQTALALKSVFQDVKPELKTFDTKPLGGSSIKNRVDENRGRGIRAARTYLELGNWEAQGVETPKEVARRWEQKINALKGLYNAIFLIGHEGSLEAYMRFTKKKIINKSFDTYFEYGDWAVLQH